MKSFKYVLISAVLTLSIIGGGLYVSCTKDACKAVTCLNGCMCAGGNCTNPPKGVGGLNCEIIYRNLYNGNVYKGSGQDDSDKQYINNTFTFTAGNDSNYTKMELDWNNNSAHLVRMPITLNTNTSSGSTFTVSATSVDTFTYTGSGVVNGVSASLTLTQRTPDSSVRIIMLNDFIKQ